MRVVIKTPVDIVTITGTTPTEDAKLYESIVKAFENNGVLGLHTPTRSVFIGAEALRRSVVEVNR